MMKQMMYTILLLSALNSCTLSHINFSEKDIDTDFVKERIRSVQERDVHAPINLDFTSIRVYKSVIRNGNILRNGVVEETAINKYGNRKNYRDPANIRNTYTLYLIITDGEGMQNVLFFPSITNADDAFVGLGPAYVGNAGIDRLNFTNILHFKTASNLKFMQDSFSKKGSDRWIYKKKENKYTFSGEAKIEVVFELDRELTFMNMQPFRITRIFKTSGNNISADKPLAFDIAQIFGDPDALIFFEKDHLPQQ
jgi:hypothetical protein